MFSGYRRVAEDSPGEAEVKKLARNHGDIIAALNGVNLVGKPHKEIVSAFKDAKRHSDKVDVLFHAQL